MEDIAQATYIWHYIWLETIFFTKTNDIVFNEIISSVNYTNKQPYVKSDKDTNITTMMTNNVTLIKILKYTSKSL